MAIQITYNKVYKGIKSFFMNWQQYLLSCFIAVLLTFMAVPDIKAAPTGDGRLLITFDEWSVGSYDNDKILADWNWKVSNAMDPNGDGVDRYYDLDSTEISNMSVVNYKDKNGVSKKCLRIRMNPSFMGVLWNPRIPGRDEYLFEYKVLLAPNFSKAIRKSKFIGLAAGPYDACSGFDSNTGGSLASQTYSCYSQVSGLYRCNAYDGSQMMRQYFYYRDKTEYCGQEDNVWYYIPPNVWTTVRLHWKLNSGDNYDGFYKVWINGQLTDEQDHLRWRSSGNTYQIDRLYFHPWAVEDKYPPTEETYIYFDDFKIWPAGMTPPEDSGEPSSLAAPKNLHIVR